MTEIAQFRRRRMLKKMAFARQIQKNAELFQGLEPTIANTQIPEPPFWRRR